MFPGSTRAAVYGMNMTHRRTPRIAQIREKEQARIEYDAAKTDGKTAALLEQQRPNVFQMNVANIMPGDDVEVELRYTELMVPTSAASTSSSIPTVVGPRYVSKARAVASHAHAPRTGVRNPYLHAGEAPGQRLRAAGRRINMPASPIKDATLALASRCDVAYRDGDKHADVELLPERRATATTATSSCDYRLAGERHRVRA